MDEIFIDVKGYEGLYQVSNLGRVKSLPKKIKNGSGFSIRLEKILKLERTKNGYLRIILQDNYSTKRFLVHRLILSSFVDNVENKETVNHKNGIKTDNRLENLEWATRSENHQHAYNTGLKKGHTGLRKLRAITDDQCSELKKIYSTGNISIRELAKKFSINHSTVYYNVVSKYL